MITEFYIYNDPDLRFLLEKKDNIELIRQKFEDELSNIFTDDGVIDFFEKWINKISNIKGILKNILIGVLVSICFAVVGNKLSDVNIIDKTSKEIVDDKIKDMSINQNYEFLNALAERESSNNWKASKGGFIKTKSGKLNKVDYVGKYQFGYYAFKDIGKEPIYHEDFKKISDKHPQIKKIYKDLIDLYNKYEEKKNPFNLEKNLCDEINDLSNNAEFKTEISAIPELKNIFDRLKALYKQYEEKQKLYDELDKVEDKKDDDKKSENKKGEDSA
jgi:hypothetical protein